MQLRVRTQRFAAVAAFVGGVLTIVNTAPHRAPLGQEDAPAKVDFSQLFSKRLRINNMNNSSQEMARSNSSILRERLRA
jgi:hypothetical protein